MVSGSFVVQTDGQGFTDITDDVSDIVRESGIVDGLAVAFIRHTSASLLIQENADPRVRDDLMTFFSRLVPENDPAYTHCEEGPDDMPAHIRVALTHTSEVIPIADRSLSLGTWQGLYLFEHRRRPHRRSIQVRVLGG